MLHKIIVWLRFLHHNQDGFFGLGGGPSSQERQQYGDVAGIGNFATSLGEGDIGAASNFWKSILSGDPSKIASVLGPEISGINKQAQQKKLTTAQFGNRGGGTNAEMQTTDDTTRSSYNSLVSGLTSSAAGELGSIGSGLLSTGLSAHEGAFDMSRVIHDQNLAKWNDLFKSISSVVAAPFTGGESLGFGNLRLPGGGGSSGGGYGLSDLSDLNFD